LPPPSAADVVQLPAVSSGFLSSPVLAKSDPGRQAAARPRAESTLVGVALLIASTISYAASDVTSKFLTGSIPPIEVAWFRYIVFLAAMLPMLAVDARRLLHTDRRMLQILRGGGTVVSTIFFLVALLAIPVPEATAIGFVSPLFITLMAVVFLGEIVGVRRWAAIGVGLIGVIVIVRPGSGAFQVATLLPLCGAVASAGSAIALRLMKDESPDTTMVYSAIVGVVILSVLTALNWTTPDWQQLAIALLGGVFVTLANLLQICAYRQAPASTLAPFTYTQLIWASGLGFLAFGILPGAATLVGGAIITASGIYTAYRERVRREHRPLPSRIE
jgi:drug/metabolite transporter (DMT)-like permease